MEPSYYHNISLKYNKALYFSNDKENWIKDYLVKAICTNEMLFKSQNNGIFKYIKKCNN